MFRNLLATVGGLFLLGYFKPAIGQRIPIINNLPLPVVTINWDGKTTNNQTASTPQNSPSPSPSPSPRWKLDFNIQSPNTQYQYKFERK